MKKLIVMAVLAAMGLQAQAQIVSSRSSMVTREVIDRGGWSTFGIEYLPSTFSPDGGSSESFTGLALNYTSAISLTQSIPLFLEWGIGGQWSFWSDESGKYEQKINFISAKIPLNLIYDYAIPNSTIHLDPFVGVKFRGNIWGQLKEEYKGESETYNLFDSDEGDWNRFQVGMQLGLKVRFDRSFFLGVGYGFDFSEIAKKTKINEFKIMAGLVF
jgi:hypothetical protein